MSHNLPHTILRSGSFVFNRRVPRAVVQDFGQEVVRVKLGKDQDQAKVLAERLTQRLDEIWASPKVLPVEITHILDAVAPRVVTLDDAVETYLINKGQGRDQNFEKVVRLAHRMMINAAGNRDINSYTRDDARAFVRSLQASEVKTATIRRRIDTIRAVFEHIFIEQEIEKRNPFARLSIPGEGLDAHKRGTFTLAQLQEIYREALGSGNEIKLIVPILGETGARLAEIVGLRLCDVDLEQGTIIIRPHSGRRLKTRGSERELPLVGAALEAMKLVIDQRTQEDEFLFPRYEKEGLIQATHASNAINKWLKRVSGGLTCHSLRHTMRDSLRAVGAPIDLIDQIGGWSSVQSVGAGYGSGYSQDRIRDVLQSIVMNNADF